MASAKGAGAGTGTQGEQVGSSTEAGQAADSRENTAHTSEPGGNKNGRPKAGKGQMQRGRAAAIYHNCRAIAGYMKMRTNKPKPQAPVTQAQRTQAVNKISKQWRTHTRRQLEALGGRRRTAARLPELRPAEKKGNTNKKNAQSQKPQRTRKLFI